MLSSFSHDSDTFKLSPVGHLVIISVLMTGSSEKYSNICVVLCNKCFYICCFAITKVLCIFYILKIHKPRLRNYIINCRARAWIIIRKSLNPLTPSPLLFPLHTAYILSVLLHANSCENCSLPLTFFFNV